MWQTYMVTASTVLVLCGSGCGERSEVVARELSLSGGGPGDGDGDVGDGDNDGAGGDLAGGGDGAGGTAGLERPRYTTPNPVDELNDPVAKDQDPSLTADQLEIFFFSDRGGEADIWAARRSSVDAPWNEPVSVDELNSPEVEQNPAISRDGLRIWYYSRREPLGIYFAERPSRTEPFGAPEPFDINLSGLEGFPIGPSVDASELRMALSIGEAETRELYEIVRPSPTGTWGNPAPLSGANSEGYADSTPFLIDDGSEMLFHSGRSGMGDLFWAYRAAPGLPFTQVAPLSEVNDPVGFDSHPHLTVDRRWLYFGSDRDGNTDIYVAEARAP